jgi:hypothetical protein
MTVGQGYNSTYTVTISPTIPGAPGTGATISLLDFTASSNGEYYWGGNYKILTAGQSYRQCLNFPFTTSYDYTETLIRDDKDYEIYVNYGSPPELPPSNGSIVIYPGSTYEVNGFYGTGAVPQGFTQFPGFEEEECYECE